MCRLAAAAALVAILWVPASWGQNTPGDDSTTVSLAERSPAQNVRSGAVRARAPGTWITAARARHTGLIDERVNGPRFGNASTDEQQQGAADTAGSAGSGTSGSSGLGSLIDQLTGSGLLGSLAGLLGGRAGLTGGTPSTGFAASGGAVGPGTAAGVSAGGASASTGIPSNIPPAALEMIRNAGIDISTLFSKTRGDGAAGGLARLPSKDIAGRAQSQQDSRKFHVRLVDSLLSTLFTALAVGVQSPDFIQGLSGLLRPVFSPPAPTDQGGQDGGAATGGGSGDGGAAGTGAGSGGGSSSGGIEDIQPGDGGSEQPDSII